MADNPISGHTAGANDGLRDGDHILSPSLTNIYEGLHGNGVLNAHDTAFGSGDRNTPASLPGAVSSSVAHQVVVKACSVILDGVPYTIDNGSGGDVTLNLTSTGDKLTGTTTTALTSGKECLFVIVATSLGAKFVQTTPVTTVAGAYSDISGSVANAYLKMDGVSAASNKQTVVLATIRATFNGSAAVANDLKLTLSELNDKRVFVRPSPFYLSPVTTGVVGSTDHLNAHTALEDIHGTGEEGDFGSNGVLWLSYNEDDNLPNLYFSAKDGSNRHTHLVGPNRIKTITASSGTVTFDFDEAQVFECNAGGAINLNPAGTFPPGHTVIVSVPSGSAVTFDSSGLNAALTAGDAALFVYNGTAWKRIMVSATTTSNASGAVGLIQFSDGAGNHNSDAKLFWTAGSSTLTVNGKLTVTGLIDPTGLVIDEKADVAATGHTTAAGKGLLWVKNSTPNELYFTNDAGTDGEVILSTSSVTDLSDVSNVGSGAIITSSERTKLTNIETVADVTDEANIKAALSGSLSAITSGSVAAGDLVFVRDIDDSNNLKTVTASSIGGLGGSGTGTAIADADADTKVDVEVTSDADTISMHTAGTERVLITDTAVNLGVDVNLVFEGSAANAHETTLTVTNPDADRTITLPNATGTVALTTDINATNVKSALNGMTLSDIGTPASTDKVLIQDTSDSDNIKYADFSEFGGGSVRTVTAGGNTLGASETLAFTAGTNITITESAGAVTITSADTKDAAADAYTPGTAPTLTGPTQALAAAAFANPQPANVAEALDRIASALADPAFTFGTPIPL